MNAFILDTETHDLHGYPIEIAYMPLWFSNNGKLCIEDICNEYFSCPEPIALGAMAVHHILESDIADKPSFDTFRLPPGAKYLVGHNVDYDVEALKKCDPSIEVKRICTLALSRQLWPEISHTLGALYYKFAGQNQNTRNDLKNAHNAAADVYFTFVVLKNIVKELNERGTSINDMESLWQASEHARTPINMPFGKYINQPISKIPKEYGAWVLKQDNIDPYLRSALEKHQ